MTETTTASGFHVPPYQGGKKYAARWIASLLPQRAAYIEPYAGMAAVLLARRPATHELLNDLDDNIHAWWVAVRDHGDELRRYLTLTPSSRAEMKTQHDRMCSSDSLPLIERAAAVATNLTCNIRPYKTHPAWRSIYYDRSNSYRPAAGTRLVNIADHLNALTERLRHVHLDCDDAAAVVERHAHSPHAVIYCDPPYADTTGYDKSASLDDLADVVRNAKASVAISGYPTCGWDDRLDGWHRVDYRRKRSATHTATTDAMVPECLWTNFKPIEQRAML